MIAEIGQFVLILAFCVAISQPILLAAGLRARDPVFHSVARAGALAQFALIAAAFVCLTWLFAVSDFSVLVVAENSHTSKPFLYKLTGVWGNHEGSMLLWVLILTSYTAALALTAKQVAPRLITLTFAVQSAVTSAFIGFLLFTSNPFERLDFLPENGRDLNPLLQDPGLASHPPMLYAGYVGFSITFAFAVAALIEGRADARWARIVRPWALAAWSFLTFGIMLGASWAYYELGWGGWWAWDPVENASLLPWLAGTAFIHSLRVMEKRDTLKSWTILLAILAFSLSLAGTFLVRSGVLTSVHSFAVDPQRGVFILAILIAVIGGALTLYGLRAHTLKPTGVFSTISRESALLLNNLVLASACALVFFGTFYPLFITTVSDQTISIGAPFYNRTFNPMLAALLVLLPIGSMLAWKRGKLGPILRKLLPALLIALIAVALALWLSFTGSLAGALGAGLALWIGVGVVLDITSRIKLAQIPLAASMTRLRNLPLGIWGMFVSHLGVAMIVFAITGVSAWNQEERAFLQTGRGASSTLQIAGYDITLVEVRDLRRENYIGDEGVLELSRNGRVLETMTAERRFYPVRQMPTTESAIATRWWGDVYATIGPEVPGRGWPVHIYLYPFALLLWIGGGVASLGGVLSIADRGRRSLGTPRSGVSGLSKPAGKG